MAIKHIFNEFDEAISLGAGPVLNNKFCNADGTLMKVRSMIFNYDCLEKGDEIYIPKEYNVFCLDKGVIHCPFIFVTIKSANGTEYHRPFSPNSLVKTIYPVDENKHRLPKKKTGGTVASWYAEQGTIENAMVFLAGKTIVVTDRKLIYIRDYVTQEIISTSLFTYEWKKSEDMHNCRNNQSHLNIVKLESSSILLYNINLSYPRNHFEKVDDFLEKYLGNVESRSISFCSGIPDTIRLSKYYKGICLDLSKDSFLDLINDYNSNNSNNIKLTVFKWNDENLYKRDPDLPFIELQDPI